MPNDLQLGVAVFISLEEVTRMESCGNYAFVFTAAGKRLLASRNLKEFEKILPCPLFFRTHQSHIINLAYVERYVKKDKIAVVLRNGMSVPVARRKKNDALEAVLLNVKGRKAGAS